CTKDFDATMQALSQKMEKAMSMIQQHCESTTEEKVTKGTKSVQELAAKTTCLPSAPPITELYPPPYADTPTKHRHESRWSGVIRDAILEGDWQPASNIVMPIVMGAGGPQYEQHDWKVLQQVKKTVQENGIKSEATRAALDWIFTADVNSPHDCRNLARLLLSPSQQIIWDREWMRLAGLEAMRQRDTNDPLHGITPEMITGKGPFADMTVQLQYPNTLHHLTAQLARQAFYAVPDENPVPSFTNVKQGLTESFIHFIDRLSAALASQTDMNEDTKQTMFKLLAFENANSKTKETLATLPKGADVGDMIELANRAQNSLQGKLIAQAVSSAIAPTTNMIAAVVQRM
ncbi:GAK8 protein, partial [Crotophaga sulcirostris]|nr:GAK8 protein [Crotophaga sulcirostris]